MTELPDETYRLTVGKTPLLVSIPHCGVAVPHQLATRFTPAARKLPDTDWCLDRLYEWIPDYDVTFLVATHSRYVVDLNRAPDDRPLYELPTTSLFPVKQFDGTPIYHERRRLRDDERSARVAAYYWPYHRALTEHLHRIRALHGYAILFDAHSIHSRVPRLFEGRLPDLNLGTNNERSCSTVLARRSAKTLQLQDGYSFVSNGRFTGGYITRHYGQPTDFVHALQLELSMRTYMDEGEEHYAEENAVRIRAVLRALVEELLAWNP